MELQDFIDLEKKRTELKSFFINRVIDVLKVKEAYTPQEFNFGRLYDTYIGYDFEPEDGMIRVTFEDTKYCEYRKTVIFLHSDIVFELDFAEKIRERLKRREPEE